MRFEALPPPTQAEVERRLRGREPPGCCVSWRKRGLARAWTRGLAAGLPGALAAAAAALDGGGRPAPSQKAAPVRRAEGTLPARQHAPSRQRQAGAGAALALRGTRCAGAGAFVTSFRTAVSPKRWWRAGHSWPASVCPKSSGWRAVGGAEAGRGPASHKPMRRRATAAFSWTRRPAPTCSSALARSKPVAMRPARRSAQARVRPPRLAPAMRTWREGWEVTTSRRWGCTPTAAARRPGRCRRRPADHRPSSPSPVRRSSHHRQTSTRSSSRRSKR